LAETSRFFTQRGVRPPFFLRSANDDRCMEMVRIGMGITTAPQSLARPGIVAVPLAGYHFRRRIGLITGARAEQDSSMTALHVAARLVTAEALDGAPSADF
jgi:DNA-binding transcriptional LysR family regulator